MIFPEQKNPTQNLATTYIRREVETAETVLKKIIPKIVMVTVFLRPMLSDNLPRIKDPRTLYQVEKKCLPLQTKQKASHEGRHGSLAHVADVAHQVPL